MCKGLYIKKKLMPESTSIFLTFIEVSSSHFSKWQYHWLILMIVGRLFLIACSGTFDRHETSPIKRLYNL